MHPDPAPAAPQLLLMSPEDNCLIARLSLAAGETVEIDGACVTLPEAVPLGYKVARVALRPGDKVLRYGALIGSITAPVAQGAILHTHNLASDYIPTHYSPTHHGPTNHLPTLASGDHGKSFTGSTN